VRGEHFADEMGEIFRSHGVIWIVAPFLDRQQKDLLLRVEAFPNKEVSNDQ